MSQPANSLTIVALVRNEIDHIAPCFSSLRPLVELTGAETLIVLNDEADTDVEEAACGAAGRVVRSRFVNFSEQRNCGLDLASSEWVFFIDVDERCTQDLAREIARAISRTECDAFRVPRRNFLFGNEVRHTGWWPDYQVRLLRRSQARYDPARAVHEFPIVSGPTCTLLHPLIHYNYEHWAHFIAKQRAYAPLEARALLESGQRARMRSLVGQPLREFKRRYIDYRGYRDGTLGLTLSIAMAIYRADVYRRMLALQRETEPTAS
jgi:(heptosyl)LPS beta-1,4-glucosyltransferase